MDKKVKHMHKPGAVIISGDFQGLGVLRCLAKMDVPVYLLDSELCIARYSKYRKKFIKSPDIRDEMAYLHFLTELGRKEEAAGSVIFANNDATVYFLSRHRDALENYFRVSVPAWEVTQYLYDKKKTYQLAEQLRIPIPKTYYPRNADELNGLDVSFPVIIKPSIRDHFYSKKKVKAFKINNREELQAIYAYVNTIIPAEEILVQEFLPGGGGQLYSFCPLFKNGEVLARIMAVRKRQHPPDFGHATTYAETVDVPLLEDTAKKLLSKINYYGLAEVEFMLDPRDQIFKLIEVNPRVWGWHTLAIGAGVPLPYLLYADMVGQDVQRIDGFKKMKWIRIITDLPTSAMEIIKGHLSIGEYMRSFKGEKEYAVFSWKDPLPFVMEFLMIPYLWFKRGF